MEENPVLPNPNATDALVADVIDQSKKGEADDNLIRLSTGVVLKAKEVNPQLIIRVITKSPRPTPPQYFDTAMGRMQENPNHPDYIDRVRSYQLDYANALLNLFIGYGTDLVSKPGSMEGADGATWVADYQALDLPVKMDSPSWRYITWVMFVAAPTSADQNLIRDTVQKLSGLKEADVQNAENFPEGHKA